MTLVSKASAFPKSVQAGIPRLGRCPEGWTREPLARHLVENLRPVKLSNDAEYDLVTVKRSRGGVVRREHLKGRDISVKSQFLLHEGDFLISKRQIVHGACGLVPADLAGSIVSNEYAVLGTKPTIDLNFLNHLAHSAYFQQTCFHSSIGVHVEKMIFKLDRWLAWDFDLPPLREQRRIAEILSTWDRAIEKAEALVANARSQKQALMQSLFTGKKRIPGFSGHRRKTNLGEICTFVGGSGFKESAQGKRDGDHPFIKVSDMNLPGNEVDIHVSQNWINGPDIIDLKVKLMPVGAVIFAKVGAALHLNKRRRIVRPTAIDNNMMAAIPHENHITSEYLFFYLSQVDLGEFAQSGAVPSVNQQHLSVIPILLPTVSEQEAIGSMLFNADGCISKLSAQAICLYREKDALMQQLLTGKLRVKVDLEGELC